jgi:hypothetical protein
MRPVLTTVNQSVTTATISKKNGVDLQGETPDFSTQWYNFAVQRAIFRSRAAENAPRPRKHHRSCELFYYGDAGIEIYRDSA